MRILDIPFPTSLKFVLPSRDDQILDDIPSILPGHNFDAEDDKEKAAQDRMQTFVFSATLSKDLQKNVKRRSKPKRSSKNPKKEKQASTLGEP